METMCRRLPWSQDADSTVHQRFSVNTGNAPLAPSSTVAHASGASRLKPDMPMLPPESSRLKAYTTMHVPVTNGTNPRSCPRLLSAGANPHRPGFRRPQ